MPQRPPTELFEYFRELGFDELWIAASEKPPKPAVPSRREPGRSHQDAPTTLTNRPAPRGVAAGGDPGHGLDPSERAHLLEALRVRASTCEACRLAAGRHSVVFGSGNADAELMFIGEGPGAEEDRQGLPFVGPAGALLTKIIEAIEMERAGVYIANVVKCRPPQNRDPLPDEVLACRDFLREQVRLVQPKVIVALGRIAAQTLLGRVGSLGSFRGAWHSYEGVPLRVTYHPAALLRDSSYKRPTWEDLKLVRARLLAGSQST